MACYRNKLALRAKIRNLNLKSQLSSSYRSQRSHGQTDMARSTRLVMLIKNICMYILYGVGKSPSLLCKRLTEIIISFARVYKSKCILMYPIKLFRYILNSVFTLSLRFQLVPSITQLVSCLSAWCVRPRGS